MSLSHLHEYENASTKRRERVTTMSSSQFYEHEDTSTNMHMMAAYPLMSSNHAPRPDFAPTLGERATKPMLPQLHMIAALVSLVCLVLGICAVVPNLSLAWHLEFSGQIIVLGFLLSIMNLSMQTILSHTFLLFETRFGESRLQNLDAIITGKFLSSHVATIWRLILLLFLALPLALSIAYKRFLGGASSYDITTSFSLIQYGIDFPRIGAWSPPNDPIYFFETAISAFRSASLLGNVPRPSADQFPIAYGYNTLLLGDNSAAILDIPTAPNISYMQGKLRPGESWYIDAPVNAYLASLDTYSDFRTNNATWNDDIDSAFSNHNIFWPGLASAELYRVRGGHVGLINFGVASNQSYFGIYYNSSVYGGLTLFQQTQAAEYQYFRNSANRYNVSRVPCQGRWVLNSSAITLVNGSCQADQNFPSTMFNGLEPYWIDALADMQYIFGCFLGSCPYTLNQYWLNPTYSIVVATMWWARALNILGGSGSNRRDRPGYPGPYLSPKQSIVSTRATLKSGILLYLVLALQPLITLAALVVNVWLHEVPLGIGFGVISILAGYRPAQSVSLVGAGFSGKLTTPVKLEFVPTRSPGLSGDSDGDTVGYCVVRI